MNRAQRILTLVATSLILFVSIYGCMRDSKPEPQIVYRTIVVTPTPGLARALPVPTPTPAAAQQARPVAEGTIARDAYGQEWIWHQGQWRRLYR